MKKTPLGKYVYLQEETTAILSSIVSTGVLL
jgi:hypothetical protein